MIEDFQKAEQCFKDGVSLNQEHLEGLLLSGLCSLTQEEFSEGEQILDATTYLYADLPLPWTLLGLHFSSVENFIMSERCFNKAEETFKKQKKGEEGDSNELSIFIEATQFVLDCNMLQVAERALSHELIRLQDKKSVAYLMLIAELFAKRKVYRTALEEVEKAIVLRHQNSDAWAMKGHLNFMSNDLMEASSCYERCLVYETQPSNLNRVYTRLAMICLKLEKYEEAKKTHLYLCKHYPSCHSWLGLGISCCQLDELEEAEHCLNEANIYDNMNGTVWSYLSLVCLKKKKTNQAEQCYRYSTKLDGTPDYLKEILDSSFKEVF